MLILSRKENEVIWIGDVKITVVLIGDNRVKIGFEAPQETLISRQELLQPNDPRLLMYRRGGNNGGNRRSGDGETRYPSPGSR